MNPNDTAQQLLQNEKFLELFQRALGGDGGSGSGGDVADMLKSMPKESDPKREEWLRTLQSRLQQETAKEAKKDLEQVHSDEYGQWMFVLPDPGFCIKTNVAGGVKVFINVCQHPRIGEPVPMEPDKENAGQEDSAEMRYRIPISCGQARPGQDKCGNPCKVYDVIVNPSTIQRCGNDHEFRRFVAALCMQWIKQKSEPTLNADEFRNLNFKCKGTLEPQRIRLSAQPKEHNAMGDEIRLPTAAGSATAPSQVIGSQGNGKLIQEVLSPNTTNANPSATATGTATPDTAALKLEPAVKSVTAEGAYNWTLHKRPASNPYFKENVPAHFVIALHLPGVQTIREVDVRIGHRRVDCYYIDEVADGQEDDARAAASAGGDEGGTVVSKKGSGASPFLSLTLDYPVSDDVMEAKYVRKTSLLKLKLAVQLPDETQAPATRPERDVTEVEEEEQERERAAREKERAAAKARNERQRQEEAAVMAERRSYVENLSMVQSGDIPPIIRDEVNQLPREQLPGMLHRLEGRIRKGDSVDALLDKLPEPMLDALIDYIREKLSLEPRPRTVPAAKGKGKAASPSDSHQANSASPVSLSAAKAADAELSNKKASPESQTAMQEFNVTKQSEALLGVAFHNRYLFALD
ncbi:putative PIH1 N-terminal domain/PIH1 CS-like domain containing protein [Leishmania utingensis]|uniref:PIH1 domain-containing protein 1 n=1 Tax=Leishmania utingensis TaxID=653362 RepID=A0AAW2ZWQ9_9TRYP